MCRTLAHFASIVVLVWLFSPVAMAQDETYDFDGHADADPQPADPTDWMTSQNWSDGGFDPAIAFGPLIPDLGTRVEIDSFHYGVNAPVIGPGDVAQAAEVRVGRANGPGLLTMTGGSLTLSNHCTAAPFSCSSSGNSRFRVGSADVTDPVERNPGTFNMSGGTVTADTLWIGSGSHGEMNLSGGVFNTRGNLFFDWTSDLTYDNSSVLNVTGGMIHVGTSFAAAGDFRLYRTSVLHLDGGQILVDGAAELGTENELNPMFVQTANVTVSITNGLLQAGDYLEIGGSIVMTGGILRAKSFNETLSAGSTVKINGSGRVQLNNSQESVATVQGLITSGFFTTNETSPLVVEIVNVDGTNFTQISVAPHGVPGDYNGNGVVDTADYVLWRDLSPAADGTGPSGTPDGVVNSLDYSFWKARFGNTSGSGSGIAAEPATVPEPTAFVYGLVVMAGAVLIRRRAKGDLKSIKNNR